ncbi:MAG: O-antigen ligase family protein [Luteococcus sp.]|uniref:O-antigen ligase family protein n=1 Tax=Luteococcus sp. TaxID=1969402 RepID=UPI002649B775|nr:O-antigen ligase family protein [Luteococcus sp.]MDN5563758.1 O-antigen ligase family protein [Luteococcus sp.]
MSPRTDTPDSVVRDEEVRLDPPLMGDTLAIFTLAFCAVTPVKGSPLLWPVLMVMVVLQLVRNGRQLVNLWVSLPLVTYLVWMWASLLWSVEPLATLNELTMNLAYVMLGLLIAVNRTVAQLLELLTRAATWLLLACWAVALAVPSFGRMEGTDYAGTMRGLFIEKNMLGYFSVIALVTALACALGPRRDAPWLRRWGPALVAVSTLLGSTSKTALSICLISLVVGWLLTRLAIARRPLALPVAGYLIVVAALIWTVVLNWTLVLTALGRDATLTGRTKIWSVVLTVIQERPLTGFGWKALWIEGSPTTIRIWARHFRIPFYHAHNGYLDLAAQLGIVGLLLALVFLFALLTRSVRAFLADPSAVSGWPVVLVTVALLYNFTEVVAFTNTTWLMLVALSSIIRTTRKEELCISPMRPA